ncbi:hypothetical protein [Pseudomonas sp. CC120222-01a]|uniref:hypothetical protein n=1 Tax=Pseudomonas sp. CC120222-01a TaxID=1378075 RepID=UPI001057B9D2|nr:hypothetical protein [Pseudomonas sp. CC120222-01a]
MPRLAAPEAERLLEVFLQEGPETWKAFSADELPRATRFAPTGGSPISTKTLVELRLEILRIKDECQSQRKTLRSDFSSFDFRVAILLINKDFLSSGECFRDDVWAFLSIVVMPDIVSWRFGGSVERYFGGVRNTFQRLWMRGMLFDRGMQSDNRWGLLSELSEDAFLQIVERPGIASSPVIATALAEAWLRASLIYGRGSMEALTRRAILKLRAKNEIRFFGGLPPNVLGSVLDEAFRDASRTNL